MLNRLLSHPIAHFAIAAFVAAGVLLCVFPQGVPHFSWVLNYAVQIMLGYLIAGLVFLFLRQPNLTFLCFGGCALLCLFLKFSIKNNSIDRWREMVIQTKLQPRGNASTLPTFTIAHINVTNAANHDNALATFRGVNADLLSIHELTPDWSRLLQDSLASLYPYRHTMVDIGIFGMAIYSKYPLQHVDTFLYQEIPNLEGYVSVSGQALCFVSVHTEPALNKAALKRLQDHLMVVAGHVRKDDEPKVVFGEFNTVAWSDEILTFTDSTHVQESRTGFMPYSNDGTTSFFELPLDHIFFTRQLMCLGFENLMEKNSNRRLGIIGTYQFRQNLGANAPKTIE